ncbi:MAG: hypothetical protein KDA24_30265, partial [Deltaproteobacteria bacterium]|nr:hypothetical protein [Deltaproteobacteria bacterium]
MARATYRSAEGAPTSRWSTSVFQGAALARAVGRSETPADASGAPLARQASSPAAAAAGWASPLAARSSA